MTTESFRTPTGVLVPAISAAVMREVDRVAVEEVGPTLHQMMENAGRTLAELCVELLGPGWVERPIVVAAGTGGNGGGGLCAARHLVNHGGQVTAVLTAPSGLVGVPADQLALLRAAGGQVVDPRALSSLRPALVVDAVLGYSLVGAPRGVAATLIEWINGAGAPVVALDVPSGIDATTGEAPGAFIAATTTLTLALPKSGLDVAAVGRLWLGDLGIPREVYRRVGVDVPRELFADGYRVLVVP